MHLNPVRAGLLGAAERLLAYPWSSWGWYLAAPRYRPQWIRVDRLLGEHGLAADTASAREEFERRMEARRMEEAKEESLKTLRRGWCLGGNQFRERMLEEMEGKLGDHHSGERHRETVEARAGRIIAEELARLGWTEGDLAIRRKSDPLLCPCGGEMKIISFIERHQSEVIERLQCAKRTSPFGH